MVEKLRGAVACAHCRSLADAASSCPVCRQTVCESCMGQDNCPSPRLRTLALGNHTHVQALDPTGRIALVAAMVKYAQSYWLHDLTSDRRVTELPVPAGESYFELGGCSAFAGGRLVWQAVTGTGKQSRSTSEYWRHWFMVADISDGSVHLTHEVETQHGGIRYFAISTDGHRAVCGTDVEVYVYDVEGMGCIGSVTLGDQAMHSLGVSSELGLIAVGLFGGLRFYGLEDRRELGRLKIDDGDITCLCIEGDRLVAISESEVPYVVDLDLARPVRTWEARPLTRFKARGDVEQGEASLSPDGGLLAAQLRKKDVVVIDVSTGGQQRLEGHRGRIALVQFTADGQLLVTSDLDGGVRLWPRDGQRIVDH